MQAIADAVILSSGWTRRAIAVAAGAFGALSLAPLDVAPALLVSMVVAVWLLDGAYGIGGGRTGVWRAFGSLRCAFGDGWWLGFGYFLGGLWWLGAAFLDDPQFAWALPLGVLGLPALLAFFTGAGFVLARLLWAPGASRIFALALGLGLAEWVRGRILSGFPWNTFGMALGDQLVTAQAVALVGLDGLTMITVALFAAPATLADAGPGRREWRPTLIALAVLAGIVGYGALRLSGPHPADLPHVVVRIMQPGAIPNDQFIPENKDKILDRYIGLSTRVDANGLKLSDVTVLVWPESAFPFVLARDPDALARIGAMLPPQTVLVTGAAREVERPGEGAARGYSDYYNSILVIASGGTVVDSYDKVHLVPFGEYLPLNGLLRRLGLRNFVAVPGGFAPGHVRRALEVPGLPPTIPLICYEAIFPDEVTLTPSRAGAANERPRLLLNVTNDGWFGLTPGPSQHFAQARLRTIEQGIPMVRGAATGISAVVDPYGRIVGELALGKEGILDAPVPQAIATPPSTKFGAKLLLAVWLATFLAWLALRLIRARVTR